MVGGIPDTLREDREEVLGPISATAGSSSSVRFGDEHLAWASIIAGGSSNAGRGALGILE